MPDDESESFWKNFELDLSSFAGGGDGSDCLLSGGLIVLDIFFIGAKYLLIDIISTEYCSILYLNIFN